MIKAWRNRISPGLLLVIVTICSLLLANSDAGNAYHSFWYDESLLPHLSGLPHTLIHWINDGCMAVFFLLVGLEIRRELTEGELSSPKRAMLPLFAAIGGMLIPALMYAILNTGTKTSHGWGIPMATDIAFALAILSMLKNAVPGSIRIFLTALAIIDDLGAVLVIAFFYTNALNTGMLMMAGLVIAVLWILKRMKVKFLAAYLLPGIFLWYFILNSGVHATIAGVLLALFIPVDKVNHKSMLHQLEHSLTPWVNFFVLPLFAIANTAMIINAGLIEQLITVPALGIILGLVIGKPLGITFFSWISVKQKMAELPKGINFNHIAAAGILGGVGFTMSIFISLLAFDDTSLQDLARLSILIASLIAGISGYIWMKKAGIRKPQKIR